MSDNGGSAQEQGSTRRLILPSLVASSFAGQSGQILTSLLLIDIGQTFGCSVSVAGQIRTLSSSVAVIFSLIMGVLSIRFNHKRLLIAGLLSLIISALSCSLAPNFNSMLLSYSLTGLGLALYSPMTTTLVGELLPLEKRTGAIGWIVAGMSLSYLIGALAIGLIAGIGGWRLSFLGYVLPILLLSVLLVTIGVPSTSRGRETMPDTGKYIEGFKAIFSNTSADACLLGYILSSAAWQFMLLYGMSFLRQRFLLSTSIASIIMIFTALSFTLGSLVCGRLVNRLGRKPLTVFTVLLVGMLTVVSPTIPNLYVYLALSLLCCVFAGMMFTAIRSLTLEQVPRFRGTTMSLSSASMQMGDALGVGVGGLVLPLFSYHSLGISLGAMGVAGALILYLLARDPTKHRYLPVEP